MADIELTLDTVQFLRTLALTEQRMKAASAKALNRTAFEVLGDLGKEAARAFAKASPRGRQFLSHKAFKFDPPGATRDDLVVTIRPTPPPKRGQLLAEHERGGIITPTKNRLGLKQDFLAVPTGVKRGASGKVPARMLPAEILARSRVRRRKGTYFGTRQAKRDYQRAARAFVAIGASGKGALLERRGSGTSSRVLSLYALIPKAQLPRIFHWEETVRRSAAYWLPKKMAEEIGRQKSFAAGSSERPRA